MGSEMFRGAAASGAAGSHDSPSDADGSDGSEEATRQTLNEEAIDMAAGAARVANRDIGGPDFRYVILGFRLSRTIP